jgi:hypothetical protein
LRGKKSVLIILNVLMHEVATKLSIIKISEQGKFPMKKAPNLGVLNNL